MLLRFSDPVLAQQRDFPEPDGPDEGYDPFSDDAPLLCSFDNENPESCESCT